MSLALRALAVTIVASAALVSVADAKVWFVDLGGRTVRWDQRVGSTIAGCPGNDACAAAVTGTVVYLRRGEVRRTPPQRRRLVRAGVVNRHGTLRFRVPHVRVGRYHLVAVGGSGEDRRWVPVSGAFRVSRGRG